MKKHVNKKYLVIFKKLYVSKKSLLVSPGKPTITSAPIHALGINFFNFINFT